MEIAESDSRKTAIEINEAVMSGKQERAQIYDTIFSGGESEDTERQNEDETSRE